MDSLEELINGLATKRLGLQSSTVLYLFSSRAKMRTYARWTKARVANVLRREVFAARATRCSSLRN